MPAWLTRFILRDLRREEARLEAELARVRRRIEAFEVG